MAERLGGTHRRKLAASVSSFIVLLLALDEICCAEADLLSALRQFQRIGQFGGYQVPDCVPCTSGCRIDWVQCGAADSQGNRPYFKIDLRFSTSQTIELDALTAPVASLLKWAPDPLILWLDGTRLVSTLPSSWGNYTLHELTLSSNKLDGTLPREWRGMRALRNLQLSENLFSGSLPPEWAGMSALRTLDLSSNNLGYWLPKEWGALKQLTTLQLGGNQIIGPLPPEWSGMTALTVLVLGVNQLRLALPKEWAGMKRLETLNLSSNHLSSSLPPEWSTMTRLVSLSLDNNRLQRTLPSEWSSMTALLSLTVSRNELSGTLPAAWATFTGIFSLDFTYNWDLTGPIPASWRQMKRLLAFYAADTDLCGGMPAGLRLTEPSDGPLRDCFAAPAAPSPPPSTVPPKPGSLLEGVNALADALGAARPPCDPCAAGCRPFWILCNSQTMAIYLSNMGLSGSLDRLTEPLRAVLQRMPASTASLYAGGNRFNGTLPLAWSAFNKIQTLVLSNNLLSGPLPRSWGALTTLQTLELSDNRLGGPLPQEWAGMKSLQYLQLSGNPLNATLPAQWAALQGLAVLRLQRCQLRGALPAEWGTLSLQALYLSDNQLDGTLPAAWSGLTSLNVMWLHANRLRGSLPRQWSSLTPLMELLAFMNQLSGPLPSSWSAMMNLKIIDLRYNQLTGPLPRDWGTLRKVDDLRLSFNRLEGTLPASWGGMEWLQLLYLDSNPGLVGYMPPEWNFIGVLTKMDLTGTFICDVPQSLEFSVVVNTVFKCARWQLLSHLWIQLGRPRQLENPMATKNNAPAWAPYDAINVSGLGLKASAPELAATLLRLTALGGTSIIDLSNNALTGTVPADLLWSTTPAAELYLGGNQLTGFLPDPIKILGVLDLSYNLLVGSLPRGVRPTVVENSEAIFTLYLDGNELSGPVPETWSLLLNSSSRWTLSAPYTGLCQQYPLAFSVDLPPCASPGPPDPERLNLSTPPGTSAYFIYDIATWPTARTTCARRGGALLAPSTPSQYLQLVDAAERLQPFKFNYKLPTSPSYSRSLPFSGFWLGLVRDSNDGGGNYCPADNPLRWVNGSALRRGAAGGVLDKFIAPQPSAYLSAECCGAVSLQQGGANVPLYSWFMFSCSAELPYVCLQQDCFFPPDASALSVVGLAAKYGTTPWQIWRDNPRLLPLRQIWVPPGSVILCPGVDGTRFNRFGRAPVTACLSALPRPCAGVTPPSDQADCFCSYHDDGSYRWPFADAEGVAAACGAYVQCRGRVAVGGGPQRCPAGRVFSEMAANTSTLLLTPRPRTDGSAAQFCVTATPQDETCADRCGDPHCLCREWLLGAGTYRNPFDSSGASAMTCSANAGLLEQLTCSKVANQTFADPLQALAVYFDPSTKTCTRSLPSCTKPAETYGGCEYTYIEQFDPSAYSPTVAAKRRRALLVAGSAAGAEDALVGVHPHGLFGFLGADEDSSGVLHGAAARTLLNAAVTAPSTVNQAGTCRARALQVAAAIGCRRMSGRVVVPADQRRFPNCYCRWGGQCPDAVLGACTRTVGNI